MRSLLSCSFLIGTVIIVSGQGELSFNQEIGDGEMITGGTVTELGGAFSVAISPDGKNVYVVSFADNGVVVFDRAADGSLSFRQEFDDEDAITGGTVTELEGPTSVFVSPDGNNVYVTSAFDNGVVVFDRAADGSLSFLQEFDDGDAITGGTVTELENPRKIIISPDGNNAYVVTSTDDGVVVFDRAADGSLSFLQEFDDGDAITGGTVTELEDINSVAVSPDGNNIYTVSRFDDGVVVFDRVADGSLSFLQEFDDGDAITGGTVTELGGAFSVTVNPDGSNVYIVSTVDDGVVVFDRAADGSLSFLQEFSDGDMIPGGMVTELGTPFSIAVSPDGYNVYVVSIVDDGVVVFDRAADGSLSFLQEFDDGDMIPGGMVTKLEVVASIVVSPDNSNVYVASSEGVVVFDRTIAGACCLPDGSCMTLTEADCMAASGTYSGDFVDCEDILLTWYADNDLDGYGDPLFPMNACLQPIGFVMNASDDCPDIFGIMFGPCDDGNEFTEGDHLNENCECVFTHYIPTLSQWGLIILGLCLFILGFVAVRKRKDISVKSI